MTDPEFLRRLAAIIRAAASEIEELADSIEDEEETEPVTVTHDRAMIPGLIGA